VLEPFISTVVLAGRIIARAGTVAQREHWVGRINAGEVRLAVAGAELDGAASSIQAVRLPQGGWRLDGTARWVVDAPVASHLLVIASTGDGVRPEAVAFVLAPDTPGVRAVSYERVDARLGASITFE